MSVADKSGMGSLASRWVASASCRLACLYLMSITDKTEVDPALWPALSGFGRSELPAVLLLRVLSTLLLPLPCARAVPCAMVWDQQVDTPVPAVLHTGPYSKGGVPAVWLGHGSATTIVGLCLCLPL